ncbi:hypothetical protein [Luteitalea sp.]
MRAEISNTILFVLLGTAGYFSTATIVALPTQLEDVSPSRGELELLKNTIRGEDRRLAVPDGFTGSDPFATVTPILDKTARRPQAAVIRQELQTHRARRSLLGNELRNATEYWTGRVKRAGDHVVAVFTENIDRKGNVERREHSTALLVWYDQTLADSQRELSECINSAAVADKDAAAWASDRVTALSGKDTVLAPHDVRWDRALEQCAQRWSAAPLPTRPELGRRFGPFRAVASWLVRTESLSLISCVGLLGFGLLGAAASSFVRDQRLRLQAAPAQSAPLVSDLAAVVVRGLVAAVVVFLAVKGGLSVFAVETPDPNPYVLLLTCLIAAIFSEPVFEWARVRIGLPGTAEDVAADGANPPVPTPVAVPPG